MQCGATQPLALVAVQTVRERRRRRRDANRRLKEFAEALHYEAAFLSSGTTTRKARPADESTSGDAEDVEIERMWRRLMKGSRTTKQAERVTQAWRQWAAGGGSFDSARFSDAFNGHRAKRKEAREARGDWGGAAWKEFEQHFSSGGFSGFADFSGGWTSDYESFYYHTESSSSRTGPRVEHPGGSRPAGLSAKVRSSLAVLGLTTSCLPTPATLKQAFHKCAMDHHPDRHASDPVAAAAAESKFKEVQAAFQLLQATVRA